MKAYEVKNGTKVVVLDEYVKVPVESLSVKKGDIVKILNLDGMYCNCLNELGDKVYIAAWSEVEPIIENIG